MRKRWLILVGVIIVAVAIFWSLERKRPPQYVTEPVTRGDVIRYLVASGTVNPVVTVQVGSYVSGVIKSIECDYNTQVRAGQLCAQIDPRPYQVAVDQAQGNLGSAQAQLGKDQAALALAKTTYERDRDLLDQGKIVSQETVDNDKSAYDQAEAVVKLDEATIAQRRAALAGAQVNLDYTRISSPVDGTVISRNIDVGQTVAASFQTPTLFLIAQDLTRMQVDTYVSESDIGSVRNGQTATFTVEGFPGTTFQGQVWQVRKAPITVQNVVTYDSVVRVDNPEGKLLPGMTANVRVITAERRDVLKVPLPALQFHPSGTAGTVGQPPQPGGRGEVWILRGNKPVVVPVTVGINDGTSVEITGGDLKAGERVIVGVVSGSARQGAGSRPRGPMRF
jgi:HlyD family secretion protein